MRMCNNLLVYFLIRCQMHFVLLEEGAVSSIKEAGG